MGQESNYARYLSVGAKKYPEDSFLNSVTMESGTKSCIIKSYDSEPEFLHCNKDLVETTAILGSSQLSSIYLCL